jgi:hypothetical protein
MLDTQCPRDNQSNRNQLRRQAPLAVAGVAAGAGDADAAGPRRLFPFPGHWLK